MKTNRLPCLLPAAIELLEARIAPATFLVTNLGDSGSGSLRDAVARANATPAQDIVLFEPSLAGTVLLQTGEILVTEPLTLKGPSSRSVTLDGNQNSRILNISSAFVTISNLGFENGRATLENGGAILSDEALSIENCRFEGNTASEGGAVYVSTFSSKKLTIKSTLVDGNVADSGAGGGLFLDTFGPINLIDSTIRGNTATQGAGGVYLHTFESAVRITDCTVTENVAGFNGGGMLLLAIDSKTFIKGSVFTKNVIAAGSNGGGGGLYSLGGDLDLKNVILAENTADHGGGASIFADKARIVSTSVSRNTSIAPGAPRGFGGGMTLSVDTPSGVNIVDSIFAENTTDGSGGGLNLSGNGGVLTIKSSSFLLNKADGTGGGVEFADFSSLEDDERPTGLSVGGTLFYGNNAEEGGGIDAFSSEGNIIIKGSNFHANQTTTGNGGGASLGGGNIVLSKTLFSSNTAKGDGGGLFSVTSTKLTLSGVHFQGNSADVNGGGAAISSLAIGIAGSVFKANHAGILGGGVSILDSVCVTKSTSIVGNVADVKGGGLSAQGVTSEVTFRSKVSIFNNTAPVNPDIDLPVI